MSIKKSLRIILIISSIIPILTVSLIIQGLLTNKITSIQKNHIEQIAETNQNGLQRVIDNQITELSLLSKNEDIKNLIKTGNNNDFTDNTKVNSLLKLRHDSYHSCRAVYLLNSENQIIASSDPSKIGYIENLSNNLSTNKFAVDFIKYVPITQSDNLSDYLIDFSYPITDDNSESGRIIGYIISTMDFSYFEEFLSTIHIGKTGHGILLDSGGTIVYHPDSKVVGNNIHSDTLSGVIDKYNSGRINKNGTFQYTYKGVKQLYSYSVIPNLNWVLFVKQDMSEIKSYTNFIFILLLLLCILLTVIIIFVANIFSKKFTAPIIALRDAMRTASDGNLTVQSNIKSKNELGELSKNFNKMLHIIKTNYEDLASMHEELLSNEEQLRTNYDHIEFLAYHDVLTNLPNKLSFLDHVNAAMVSTPYTKKIHAVYFVDLDNFKTINDTLGHEYGDALLVKTAEILCSLVEDNDMLARAGGDEFLIFKDNIKTKEASLDFAAEIIECFKNPVKIEDEIVYISMSIGISIYPDNGFTPNALIKNADIAMYRSKDTGKNKFTLFDKKMEEELNRNTLILEVLRTAINNNEIYIQYQPLVDINSNTVSGFEALMRIRSERLGNLSPSEFIPIAEESGLIIELSTWLLKEACLFNKQMIDHGITARPVSVNISSVQINRPGFVTMLSEVLEETELPPQYLELEITESTLVSSLTDTNMLLSNLQNLGVRLSLDDFGTGYSSLNYLTRIPINTLKIDKSFIDNICINDKDTCIAETIIQLAHSLDIRVVAEGVETDDQLDLLKSKNCDIIQGYIFSKPVQPEDLIELIHSF